MDALVVVQGDAELLHVVEALGAPRRLPRRLHRGEQQRDQDGDDRDDDQQLDQGESRGLVAVRSMRFCTGGVSSGGVRPRPSWPLAGFGEGTGRRRRVCDRPGMGRRTGGGWPGSPLRIRPRRPDAGARPARRRTPSSIDQRHAGCAAGMTRRRGWSRVVLMTNPALWTCHRPRRPHGGEGRAPPSPRSGDRTSGSARGRGRRRLRLPRTHIFYQEGRRVSKVERARSLDVA